MTSGNFISYPISSITVDRQGRQRRELRGIDELAESISRIGLIHPIVITPEGVLVAGERRLTACHQLGWTAITVQFTTDLPPHELKVLELEENARRLDLTWQERCLAVLEYHETRKGIEDDWTQKATAQALGYDDRYIGQQLEVASEIVSGNEKIINADKFSVARNVVERDTQRRKASQLASVGPTLALVVNDSEEEETITHVEAPPILNLDFHLWQETYNGPKFNLLHCDFPYGIMVADAPRQNSAIRDHYVDSPDIYWSLLERLSYAMDNVVAESAHLIFWYDMGAHCATLEALRAMGWTVWKRPLIWHKLDNSGVAPDPQRWPRNTYETALIASRGDRKLTQAGTLAGSIGFPGRREDEAHVSEKPLPVIRHFMRMYCDEYSSVLDPTCGSGSALKAAKSLGAANILGLELDSEFHADACRRWYD